MKKLSRAVLVCGIGLAAMVGVSSIAQQKRGAKPAAPAGADVARGRYLVEEVAKCPECHTPRNANGELDGASWLTGAPIWIRPVANIQPWADHAPALAGLGGFTDAQVERVLEQGTGPNGEAIRPPMHIYHMNHQDAQAIAAYLKSLPASRQ